MLAACAARFGKQTSDLVWVDLGGGTGVSLTPGLHLGAVKLHCRVMSCTTALGCWQPAPAMQLALHTCSQHQWETV